MEEFGNDLFLLEQGESQTTVVHVVLFRAGEDRLYVDTERFSLSEGRADTLVHDQRARHVGQHRCAMVGLAAKVIKFLIMTHNNSNLKI